MKKLITLAVLLLPLTVSAQLVDGLEGTAGSAVGPGRALFVTENNMVTGGRVTRIDPRSGDRTTYAYDLPSSWLFAAAGIGGAVDVAFLGDKAYVLVTGVGAPFGGFVDGVYRIDGPDTYTVIANIGEWAAANPPVGFPFVLPNGLQYSIEVFKGGFLVTDGHHNRILRVTLDGNISEFFAFDTDVVPTGLEVWGNRVHVAAAGPTPHTPATGRVFQLDRKGSSTTAIASGIPLIVDVERGRGDDLYALSQGIWVPPPGCEVDPAPCAGAPASPGTGALVEYDVDGEIEQVIGAINLPTSMEIIHDAAYVITLSGEVLKFDNLSALDD